MRWLLIVLLAGALWSIPVLAEEPSVELTPDLPAMTVAEAEEIASGWTTGLSDPTAEVAWILTGKHKGKEVVGGSARFAQYHGEIGGIGVDPSLDVGLLYVNDATAESDLENVYLALGASLDLSEPAKKVAGVILGKIPVLGTALEYLSARVGGGVGVNVKGDFAANLKASLGIEIPL